MSRVLMTRRELRRLSQRREGVNDDGVRYTTHDFVRRGIVDAEGGPMSTPLSFFEAQRAARSAQALAAANDRASRLKKVRPYVDFHVGQAHAEWLRNIRGREPEMTKHDALADRVLEARRDLLLAPSAARLVALIDAENDLAAAESAP